MCATSYSDGDGTLLLANKPGALAQLAGKLAKKGINIDCAYATMPKGRRRRWSCWRFLGLPCEKAARRLMAVLMAW